MTYPNQPPGGYPPAPQQPQYPPQGQAPAYPPQQPYPQQPQQPQGQPAYPPQGAPAYPPQQPQAPAYPPQGQPAYPPQQPAAPAPYPPQGAPAYPPQQPQYPPQGAPAYPPQGGYGAPQQPQQVRAPASVDTAKPGSGGGSDFLDSGVHNILIKRCKYRVSEKPGKIGHVMFIIEAVVESTTPGQDASRPNYPGQEVGITADLNGYGAGDVKTWIAQIMGGNPNEVTASHVDWVAGDTNPFGDTRCTVSSKLNGKGTFTHHRFTVTQPGPRLQALANQQPRQ